MTKGFNDIPTSLQLHLKKNTQNLANVPYGTAAQYMRVTEYLRGGNVDAKYTEREILTMLHTAKYFIIKSSNQDNINLSRIYSEWATTRSNEVITIFDFLEQIK